MKPDPLDRGPLDGEFPLRMHNYMVDLLPFMDEQSIYSIYRRDAMFVQDDNVDAIASTIRTALCPSAPTRDAASSQTFVPSLMFA